MDYIGKTKTNLWFTIYNHRYSSIKDLNLPVVIHKNLHDKSFDEWYTLVGFANYLSPSQIRGWKKIE